MLQYGTFYKQLEIQRRNIVNIQNSLRDLATASGHGSEIAEVIEEFTRQNTSAAKPEPSSTAIAKRVVRPAARTAKAYSPHNSKHAKNSGCAAAIREFAQKIGPGSNVTVKEMRKHFKGRFHNEAVIGVTMATFSRGRKPIFRRLGGGSYEVTQNAVPAGPSLASLARS